MTFSRSFKVRPDETLRAAATDATLLTGLTDEHLVLYEAGITVAELQADTLVTAGVGGYNVSINGWSTTDGRGASGLSVSVGPNLVA